MLKIKPNEIINNKLLLCYTKHQSDFPYPEMKVFPKYDNLLSEMVEEIKNHNRVPDEKEIILFLEITGNTPVINNQLPLYYYKDTEDPISVYLTGNYMTIYEDYFLFLLDMKKSFSKYPDMPKLNFSMYKPDEPQLILANKTDFKFVKEFLDSLRVDKDLLKNLNYERLQN